MKEFRRSRLVDLLAGPRFNGDRAAFCQAAEITNGRLSQLLDQDEAFGELAARNLCEKLALPADYFTSTGTPGIAVEAANSGAALAKLFEKLPQSANLRNLVFVKCVAIIGEYLPSSDPAPTSTHGERDTHETPGAKHPA